MLGSIFAANYHSLMSGRLAGVPAPAAEAAHDSIGKAVGVLDQVPANVAEVIHADATNAFLQSMHVVYPIAALVIAVAIGVTLKWLPARAPVVAGGVDASHAEASIGLEDAVPGVPDDLVEPDGTISTRTFVD